MIVYGLVVALIALLASPAISFICIMGGALALVLWAMLYSHWLYHHLGDGNRPAA
jgi:hypothetical protein